MGHEGEGSVTRWIDRLKVGDGEAASRLWGRYFHDLIRLARARLRDVPRRGADEEDAALSAFHSLCRGARTDRFPRLDDRQDLWRILVTITTRKAANLAQRERRLKRGSGRVLDEATLVGAALDSDVGLDQVPGREPSPEMAAMVVEESQQLLAALPDSSLRLVATLRLEGYTVAEIATNLDCGLSTVERRLRTIRKVWAERGGHERRPAPDDGIPLTGTGP